VCVCVCVCVCVDGRSKFRFREIKLQVTGCAVVECIETSESRGS
jgi:hypothetical protein